MKNLVLLVLRENSVRNHRATDLLELVHSDLVGPMEVSSVSGMKYILIFVDDCSRKIFVYYLKNKSDVVSKFKDFKAFAKNQTGKSLKVLRTDNGKEYVNAELKRLLTSYGIKHELVVPYNSQQNDRAERVNRTIVEMGRCMIQEAGCSKQLWADACSTAVYIKNRTTRAAIDGTAPEEKWSGKVLI
jgi:transposase InsO family protein